MDFRFDRKAEAFRQEIREFVKENIPIGESSTALMEGHADDTWEFAMSIAKKLSARGWLTISWPNEYTGLNVSVEERLVFGEETGYWGIPGTSMGVSGIGWVGPSLLLFGTKAQQEKHLPLIASADSDGVWCTGYSEPDSGSDFASLQTRAERQGDSYIINGQKIWTSEAHRARYCWLAARTNADVEKKHHGISIIIVDMKSEGITVRPIPTYYGAHSFNEVFFTNVEVPVDNLVGEENRGWYQLMQSLAMERGIALGSSGRTRRILDELIQFARETDLIKKPIIRQKLADVAVDIQALRVLAYEAAWKTSQGLTSAYEPSRDKAYNDVILHKLAAIGNEVLGAYAQLDSLSPDSKWTKLRGSVQALYHSTPGMATAAGTTDTMRNIVGQFGLQLPKSY